MTSLSRARPLSVLASATRASPAAVSSAAIGSSIQIGSWALRATSTISALATIPGLPSVAKYRRKPGNKDALRLGTLRARFGYSWNRVFLYGTGGLAFGNVKSSVLAVTDDSDVFAGSYSKVRFGWTAGAGVEYAFADRWSAKLEYLHFDLGSVDYLVTQVSGGDNLPPVWNASAKVDIGVSGQGRPQLQILALAEVSLRQSLCFCPCTFDQDLCCGRERIELIRKPLDTQ